MWRRERRGTCAAIKVVHRLLSSQRGRTRLGSGGGGTASLWWGSGREDFDGVAFMKGSRRGDHRRCHESALLVVDGKEMGRDVSYGRKKMGKDPVRQVPSVAKLVLLNIIILLSKIARTCSIV
jgi:hypothetical protein